MAEGLNQRLFNEAKGYIAGGVNSPVRAFRQVGGEPIFIKSACGSKIYSEDGREFIDYCQSFGASVMMTPPISCKGPNGLLTTSSVLTKGLPPGGSR